MEVVHRQGGGVHRVHFRRVRLFGDVLAHLLGREEQRPLGEVHQFQDRVENLVRLLGSRELLHEDAPAAILRAQAEIGHLLARELDDVRVARVIVVARDPALELLDVVGGHPIGIQLDDLREPLLLDLEKLAEQVVDLILIGQAVVGEGGVDQPVVVRVVRDHERRYGRHDLREHHGLRARYDEAHPHRMIVSADALLLRDDLLVVLGEHNAVVLVVLRVERHRTLPVVLGPAILLLGQLDRVRLVVEIEIDPVRVLEHVEERRVLVDGLGVPVHIALAADVAEAAQVPESDIGRADVGVDVRQRRAEIPKGAARVRIDEVDTLLHHRLIQHHHCAVRAVVALLRQDLGFPRPRPVGETHALRVERLVANPLLELMLVVEILGHRVGDACHHVGPALAHCGGVARLVLQEGVLVIPRRDRRNAPGHELLHQVVRYLEELRHVHPQRALALVALDQRLTG